MVMGHGSTTEFAGIESSRNEDFSLQASTKLSHEAFEVFGADSHSEMESKSDDEASVLGEEVSADKIRQSSTVGDCYFLASLSSLAATDGGAQKIKEMIRNNEDGSLTVTFPGAKDSPVTVSDEDIDSSQADNDAKWADVLEAAYLKLSHERPWANWAKVNGIGLLSSVTFRETMELLTGEPVFTDQFSFLDIGSGELTVGTTSKDNARQDLEEARETDKIVTAVVTPDFLRKVGLNDGGLLPDLHTYSVIDFDKGSDTVTVRNPWKSMPGSELSRPGSTFDGITHDGGGMLRMSFDKFYDTFNSMSITGRRESSVRFRHVIGEFQDVGRDAISGVNHFVHGRRQEAGDSLRNLGVNSLESANEAIGAVFAVPHFTTALIRRYFP